jgi:hypothetical protein
MDGPGGCWHTVLELRARLCCGRNSTADRCGVDATKVWRRPHVRLVMNVWRKRVLLQGSS